MAGWRHSTTPDLVRSRTQEPLLGSTRTVFPLVWRVGLTVSHYVEQRKNKRLSMKYTLIDSPEALQKAGEALSGIPAISLDCEAAGFHRYSDRLCLVQLSTPAKNLILDPLTVDLADLLRPALEDPSVKVIMHGGDYDIRLLHRDLGLRPRGVFDTQIAASLLGAPAVGLAALLEAHLNIRLPKKHQRADWAQRPLPDGMLEYAANDTEHLMALAEILSAELRAKDRVRWAEEEFQLLEAIEWEEETVDPVTRVKGARDLSAREVTGLRAALNWRDEIARKKDRAPFRVVGDQILLEVVVRRPNSPDHLADLKGFSPRLARQQGKTLLSALERVDTLPEEGLEGYPRWKGDGNGRPSPEEEAQANRIRDLRTGIARELGIDRGVLLSNAQILELVRHAPKSPSELEGVAGLKQWQKGVLGEKVLGILNGA